MIPGALPRYAVVDSGRTNASASHASSSNEAVSLCHPLRTDDQVPKRPAS